MAFYGSSAANLSPILFKGNLFSNGVNIIFHSDISYSMNLIPGGSVNYRTPREDQPGEIGPGAKSTMALARVPRSFREIFARFWRFS